jgi:hypothetical protein
MTPEETICKIVVYHENADPYPDRIEMPGSTKRAGFTCRVNSDEPGKSFQRIKNMAELARQATKEALQ